MFIPFIELFERQVVSNPNNKAIISPTQKSYDYKTFNTQANKVAHYLITLGITQGDIIGFCIDKSRDSYLIVLALLKLRVTIVPLDSSYPKELLEFIINDSQIRYIVSANNLTNVFSTNTNSVDLTNYLSNLERKEINNENLSLKSNPCDIIYIVYTSGSTGTPKGVCMTQGAVGGFLDWESKYYNFIPKEKVLQYAPLNFDIFFQECLTTWVRGGELVLFPAKDRNDPEKLLNFINEEKINKIILPYLMVAQVAQCALVNNTFPSSIDKIISTGEAFVLTYYINRLRVKLDKCKFYNLYGASENQIISIYELTANDNNIVPIGTPITNCKVYILDNCKKLIHDNKPGELYASSPLLSEGYLNNPLLTKEKFIINPFQTEEEKKLGQNSKLYKTGDLVRWLPDGNIEYIGRNDFQVKIRGYRVELGEIESVLLSFKGIEQCVIITKEHIDKKKGATGSKYLAGYYVSTEKLNKDKIFNYLQSKLPDYMVPTILMQIENLPLTINGKVNREALPAPQLEYIEAYTPPRNKLERQIRALWTDLIDVPIDKLGIRENFFKLGGNSILAIRLISKLSKKLNTKINIAAIFKSPTIEKLAYHIKYENKIKVIKIPRVRIHKKTTTSLSFAQERLWFIEKYEGGTNAYNIPMVYKISSTAKLDLIDKSIRSIISRHEILRTLIKEDSEGKGYQQVIDDNILPLDIRYITLNNKSSLNDELSKEAHYIFDLSSEYPIRVCFLKLKEECYLSIVVHHIAFDGWSIDVFLTELCELYNYYSGCSSLLNLPELSIQYKDFAIWQRSYLTGERLEKQLNYWREKLEGYETLNLLTDKVRPSQIDYTGTDIYFDVDQETSNALRELAKELKVSLYSVLLAGYFLLLRGFSNQDDIVIGTPIANRHYSQIESLIGFFVNTLAVRTRTDSSLLVKEFIFKVWQEATNAHENQDLPFEKLVEELKVPKDTSRHPIFQVLFGLDNFEGKIFKKESNLKTIVEPYRTEDTLFNIAKFDVSLFVDDSHTSLKYIVNYAVSLYEKESIISFIEAYKDILRQLAWQTNNKEESKSLKVSDIIYLNKHQYKQVIYEWNNTEKSYPADKTIHSLIEIQAEKTPHNIAIVCDDTKLSYGELNEKANQLANYLTRTYKILPNNLIALCVDRDELMFISILAILKAGGAYVPIDPSYPPERIEHILEDTGGALIITNERYKQKLQNIFEKANNNSIQEILPIDNLEVSKTLLSEAIYSPTISVSPHNLAYIIYTSGTTGIPKGIKIAHVTIVNLVHWKTHNRNHPPGVYHIAQFAKSIFDISLLEFCYALVNGYELYIVSEPIKKSSDDYATFLVNNKIHSIFLTTIMLELLAEALLSKSPAKLFLKEVFVAGEVLKITSTIKKFFNKYPTIKLINQCGPSESHVMLSYTLPKKASTWPEFPPIGKLIDNFHGYVLNDSLQPLPIGVAGELYISGVGLSKGYINRPLLNADKFIANPFQTEEEKKLDKNSIVYKSGDLVRWLPDGNMEFIGRNDFQVKIRGYRVELGEVESALSSFTGVEQSVVLAKEHIDNEETTTGSKYLIGYYVSTGKLNEDNILNHLQTKLPDYMIPSFIIHLKKLPLTINGKIDKKALPTPQFRTANNYRAPRNEIEKELCEVWSEILRAPKEHISINDDFFRIGGNSILAIRLVTKLNKKLNTNIHVAIIFKSPTLEKLAQQISSNKENNLTILKANLRTKEEHLLSFAQERLWFIEKYEGGTNAYNIPMVYKISSTAKLDLIDKSIRSIISRHEILRTLIKEDSEGKGYQQVIDDNILPLDIRYITLNNKSSLNGELSKEAHYIFDLSSEYPIRVCFLKLKEECYLSIVVHHIAFDGWSIDVFLTELYELYNYYSGCSSLLNLPELSIQYKDFAIWQRSYLTGERLEKQLNYWREKLEGYETLNLLTDKVRPSQIDYTGTDIYFDVDQETSNALRELAKELKVSLYSVLLAGYYLMLKCYSNQDDIVIGTPVANRQYPQIDNLAGLFINSLALRINIQSDGLIKDLINNIKFEVSTAQLYQDLPFEKLVDELKVLKDTSRHPVFQVMFTLQSFGEDLLKKQGKQKKNKLNNLLNKIDDRKYDTAMFDLSVFMDDSKAILRGVFNYATRLYNEDTILRFIDTYTQILYQFASIAYNKNKLENTKVSSINYLNPAQYQQIVYQWNNTDAPFPEHKTIHKLFEEQAERTPNNIALIYENIKLTYRELNEKANQLANYISKVTNIKPDTMIALCLDRSEHMLISILAVLKAGGAYVPIDPNYPEQRIKYILQDTNARLLLTNAIHKQKLHQGALSGTLEEIKQIHTIFIDDNALLTTLGKEPLINPITTTTSTNLAYVIYTSGTTGNPKGVMIEHKGIVNTIFALDKAYNFNLGNKITAFTSFVFDVSITEFLAALLRGGELHLLSDCVRSDSFLVSSYVKLNSINFVYLPPALLSAFPREPHSTLYGIVYAGEPCDMETGKYWSHRCKLYNYYGPTEATIYSTGKQIFNNETNLIGTPIPNVKNYILNRTLTPQPIGAIGELHIGGVGLARGYLNKPQLTLDKFISNPFQTEEEKKLGKNSKLYKTGDLVRWLPDGNIEYIGRNDFQVKIRGYRIELGEIENALLGYNGITQSVVLAKDHATAESIQAGSKYLVGYYVAENKLEENDILSYLQIKLPDYMVPVVLVHLNKLPLTINGKLDRNALPAPNFINKEAYVPPRNELEKQLCKIWAEVLGLPEDKVGIQDDFFRLGGNSILALKLINKINKELNSTVSLSTIFKFNIIEKLTSNIHNKIETNLSLNSTEYEF